MGARKKNEEEAEVRNRSVGKEEMHFNRARQQGDIYQRKKNNTRSKDTTDKAARHGRMEGKQLQTLSFPWVLNQEIFLSTQSHAIPEGWHLGVVVPPCGCSVFFLYLYQLSGGGPKANQTRDDKDASEEAGETPSCPPQ